MKNKTVILYELYFQGTTEMLIIEDKLTHKDIEVGEKRMESGIDRVTKVKLTLLNQNLLIENRCVWCENEVNPKTPHKCYNNKTINECYYEVIISNNKEVNVFFIDPKKDDFLLESQKIIAEYLPKGYQIERLLLKEIEEISPEGLKNIIAREDVKYLRDLEMKCGDCPIIDYCNSSEDTPLCSQGRFKDVPCEIFANLIKEVWDNSKAASKEILYDEVEESLEDKGFYNKD